MRRGEPQRQAGRAADAHSLESHVAKGPDESRQAERCHRSGQNARHPRVRAIALGSARHAVHARRYAADPDDPSAATKTLWNSKPREPPSIPRKMAAFADNTGIIYWIGTGEGKETVYRNPVPEHIAVTLSSSAGLSLVLVWFALLALTEFCALRGCCCCWAGGPVQNIADRNLISGAIENRYGGDPNPWIEVSPGSFCFVAVEQFLLRLRRSGDVQKAQSPARALFHRAGPRPLPAQLAHRSLKRRENGAIQRPLSGPLLFVALPVYVFTLPLSS